MILKFNHKKDHQSEARSIMKKSDYRARIPRFSNLSIKTGKTSIPGAAMAILEIVTIEIP